MVHRRASGRRIIKSWTRRHERHRALAVPIRLLLLLLLLLLLRLLRLVVGGGLKSMRAEKVHRIRRHEMRPRRRWCEWKLCDPTRRVLRRRRPSQWLRAGGSSLRVGRWCRGAGAGCCVGCIGGGLALEPFQRVLPVPSRSGQLLLRVLGGRRAAWLHAARLHGAFDA